MLCNRRRSARPGSNVRPAGEYAGPRLQICACRPHTVYRKSHSYASFSKPHRLSLQFLHLPVSSHRSFLMPICIPTHTFACSLRQIHKEEKHPTFYLFVYSKTILCALGMHRPISMSLRILWTEEPGGHSHGATKCRTRLSD